MTPKPAWVFLLIEGGGILIFGFYAFRGWPSMVLWNRALLIWIMAAAVVAWFYQLSGSEVVEFDSKKLSISRNVLGWTRTSEHPLERCTQLEWRDATSDGETAVDYGAELVGVL